MSPLDLWVLAQQLQPNVWVTHCLDFDVMSAGDTLEMGLSSLLDAVGACLEDDFKEGVDPLARPKAPAIYWTLFIRALTNPTPELVAANLVWSPDQASP